MALEAKVEESHISDPLLAEGKARLLGAYLLMWKIRRYEEKVEELYSLGKVHGTMHLSIGQEAIPGAWSLLIEPDDYLISHHRGHGHCLAKGASPDFMMAELLGKETGYCRGRGGSMHIADVTKNNLGANGVVGGGIPIAVGLGLSIKMKQEKRLALSVFGDGATNTGSFHEALNLAAVWNVPVLFICENNQYAMSMPVQRAMKVAPFERAKAYGIPSAKVDGMKVPEVYAALKEAVEYIRAGNGPYFIEAVTYRYRGHSKSDRNLYRTREEINEWRKKDPIDLFHTYLIENNVASDEELDTLRNEATSTIEKAVEFAETQPDPRCEDLLEGVYAP